MSASLQVIYPITDSTEFNHSYYESTHMGIVNDCMGPFIDKAVVTKGLAGGPDVPPAFHAIATLTFKDMDTLQACLAAAGPALEDIPNFYNAAPQVLVGEVTG